MAFNQDVLSLSPTKMAQSFEEIVISWHWRSECEIAYPSSLQRLLRARHERPGCSASDKRNELAAPHVFASVRGLHPTTSPQECRVVHGSKIRCRWQRWVRPGPPARSTA